MKTKIFSVRFSVKLTDCKVFLDPVVEKVKVSAKDFAQATGKATVYAKKKFYNFEPYETEDGEEPGKMLKYQYKNFDVLECSILEESDI